mmetsp:Transcript_16624/g.24847  ORF Transcript_16624/g.24847 Transcript_16624/m.24847 type:complete len:736 (-) Transcript_16624:67-2274(-)|eukprot:CAMPEP_0203682202 /NCGR_PEP_ID=MMETSP0090-20130426/45073_1 /ASSEMBLY_ACC=CAM_ASM_001088 /TAXON_ID=426623 /ORGANISM="Chaetoceros affinis, Strain CCMP159" /LENGTH=735 /DNA_ID=CAMNT_0050551021 /DNA_START=222 /DNA_END=2429 /DNA_ORIENTATION=+
MTLSRLTIASTLALYISLPVGVSAFSQSRSSTYKTNSRSRTSSLPSTAVAALDNDTVSAATASLDYKTVNKLTFRELQRTCKEKGLPAVGSTATLRSRILESLEECVPGKEEVEECIPVFDGDDDMDIQFFDESDPDFEFKSLLAEVNEKAEVGHWKAATRKLKKLSRRYVDAEKGRTIPEETYIAVLEACLANRLHGARASEPARKILEDMADNKYVIPATMGNQCVLNCLGNGPNGSHDGCGGIDTALAMLAAMESSSSGSDRISVDTYGSVVSALARDGAVDESLLLLRAMVVEHSFTPALSTFADVARSAAKAGDKSEDVLQVMTLTKASGYILDSIASAEAGRDLLGSGVVAAEQMDNLALGLRFLTAASKAEGCAPDRGDDLVASSSSAAQRASTLIHKRAIIKAFEESNWKLAVKLLQLMKERSLNPANSIWRKVVTLCAKEKKSRRATALLFDWITAYEEGEADIPPIQVFNTVVNACESVKEETLTLDVLEAMRKVHGNSGNIVTSNIALKRLAKLGNTMACEGLIIGMLQENVEPNVVTYTTAIGACVQASDSAMAEEWIRRMKTRNVMPNYQTYNTALAACLDGKLESTMRASKIATDMLADIDKELENGVKGDPLYNSVIPDSYTKVLSRSIMKQLRENWRAGDINMAVAKSTVRVPLLKLVDFDRSQAAEAVEKLKAERVEARKKAMNELENEDIVSVALEASEAEVDLNELKEMVRKRMEV